ncbi:uncharacterized protein LOC135223552 isoform X2 [Macrobrachium nipponense]|uniref:uncharacterized protein LOC135223552 isoform X2 n=1 Tax=Macrobrachium nipponense TaxID=159736 RepID=UPI0030C894A5
MADIDSNTFYKPLKNNFGYCLRLNAVSTLLRKHEENTSTRYSLIRSDPNFGNSTWNNEDCRIQWEEGEKIVGERLMFDGVPFFVLGTRYLGCQFGNESDQKMSIYLDLKDSPSGQCEAKREKCPAKIILKEVIKFPHYKIESNTNYEKKKWSKLVRDDLCKGTAKTERRIYVELPKSDAHVHTITWKTSGVTTTMPTHCLVCNARLSSSTRATVSLFSDGVRTSHRQLEVASVLSSIVNKELIASNLHSTMICSKCFNLIDDIDALEEQLSSKKQHVMDKFERTLVEVNGKAELKEDAVDELDSQDDQLYGKRPRVERKRGRPPGPK